MKLVTFSGQNDEGRLGACIADGGAVLDLKLAARVLGREARRSLESMQALIEGGEKELERVRALVEAAPDEAIRDLAGVRLLAPLPRPPQMRDFICFEQHLKQAGEAAIQMRAAASDDPEATAAALREAGWLGVPDVWYEQPLYYKCNRFSVCGPEVTVTWPAYSTVMDFELELACVIGKQGRDIARADAPAHIFGYTIFNDLSARDAQMREMRGPLGPAKGKDFDNANVLGPCIVTADEIADPYNLTMIARIDGEQWCKANSGSIHWKFDDMIAHVSQAETLHPGEVLGSGTVGGGCGLEHQRFLEDGAVVELEIEGIGVLRNRVIRGGSD